MKDLHWKWIVALAALAVGIGCDRGGSTEGTGGATETATPTEPAQPEAAPAGPTQAELCAHANTALGEQLTETECGRIWEGLNGCPDAAGAKTCVMAAANEDALEACVHGCPPPPHLDGPPPIPTPPAPTPSAPAPSAPPTVPAPSGP